MLREIINANSEEYVLHIPKEYLHRKIEILVLPFEDIEIDIENSGEKYNFSNLAGKLTWQGNSVIEQRKCRDEWN